MKSMCGILLLACLAHAALSASNALAQRRSTLAENLTSAAKLESKYSQEQQTDFVNRLTAFVAGNRTPVDVFDTDEITRKLMAKTKLDRKALVALLGEEILSARKGGFCEPLIRSLKRSEQTDLLRFRERDGFTVAQFRLLFADGHFSYAEFAVATSGAMGKLKVVDSFDYERGEWSIDDCIKRAAQAVSVKHPKLVEAAYGIPSPTKHDLTALDRYFQSSLTQNWKGQFEAIEALPKVMRESLQFQIVRAKVAALAGEAVAERATMEGLKRRWPDNPKVNSLAAGYHQHAKEFDQMLEDYDALDHYIGGDPYLDLMRSGVYLKQEKFDEALASGQRALQREPSLWQAYSRIGGAALKKKDFAVLTESFKALAQLGKTDFETIESVPGLAAYIASPEFKAWKAESQAREPAKK